VNGGKAALVEGYVFADKAAEAVDDCAVCHGFRRVRVSVYLPRYD
jgi:hypothetical protein